MYSLYAGICENEKALVFQYPDSPYYFQKNCSALIYRRTSKHQNANQGLKERMSAVLQKTLQQSSSIESNSKPNVNPTLIFYFIFLIQS